MAARISIPSPLEREWERTLDRWALHLEDVTFRFLDRQRKIIVARITGAKTRRAVLERGRKLEVKSIFDEIKFRAELKSDLTAAITVIFETVGAEVLERIGDDDAAEFKVTPQVETDVADLVDIAAHTQGFEVWIVGALQRAADEGIPTKTELDDLAKKIDNMYKAGARQFGARVGRTATTGAVNGAGHAAATQTKKIRRKGWLTIGDAKVRLTHGNASDQGFIPRDELFIVGGFGARYPGDPTLPGAEQVNCRCSMIFEAREVAQEIPVPPLVAKGLVLRKALELIGLR